MIDALRGAETVHRFAQLHGGPARLLAARAPASICWCSMRRTSTRGRAIPTSGPTAGRGPTTRCASRRSASAPPRSAAALVPAITPDVVHAHDWQAGLAPALLHYGGAPRPGTVMTVHNLAFQGQFPRELLAEIGLPPHACAIDGVEYHGTIGYLKAGLALADRITTVSPTYAAEIRTPEGGMGLDGLLRQRADVLTGILNGIDDAVWNPATDAHLAATFDARHLPRRAANKAALQARFGLDVEPKAFLLGVVSRLTLQKGMDLLLEALPAVIGHGAQLALLGAGDKALEAAFAAAAARHPGRVAAVIGYDEALAHLMQAVVDALLVPSRFEPCGLTQLCALRYGAIPIVARVGGLADTVIDANEMALAAGAGTGVQFAPVTREQPRARDRPRDGAVARRRALARAAVARDGDRRRLDAVPRSTTPRSSARWPRSARPDPMRRAGPGSPEPLGVTPEPGGANVAVVLGARDRDRASASSTPRARPSSERIALPERTGDVFHGFVAGVAPGDRYGLRAHGPYDPRHGHRFNPAKLLVDPYARALDRPFALHPSMFDAGAADGGRRPQRRPTAARQRAVRAQGDRHAAAVRRRRLAGRGCRGATRSSTSCTCAASRGRIPACPRRCAAPAPGLAHPAAIAHLTRLGITTVELMPIAAAIDERHLARLGLTNYWGYNPVALFVPDPRLAPGGIDELAGCVAALHAAGIEVILDVVLNHTGEGDALGPTLSLRGLDNATYYRTFADDRSRYVDDTGCGNTLALDRPPVLRLAMDVLRHYAEAAGVDGFRFDLATTLGRRADGPRLRSRGAAAAGDRAGSRRCATSSSSPSRGTSGPAAIASARFRRPGANGTTAIATRCAGSGAATRDSRASSRRASPARPTSSRRARGRRRARSTSSPRTTASRSPTSSRSTSKHNEANGEDNRDGTDANFSWNHGVEGATTDAAIRARRDRDVRNLLATLLLSRGTPMLAMGDELGRTQRGNNNAYAQDNALTWVDWDGADEALVDFVAALVDLRRRHPALRADRWLTGAPADASGIADVEWRHPDGRAMNGGDWARADGAGPGRGPLRGRLGDRQRRPRRRRAQRRRRARHGALAGPARGLRLAPLRSTRRCPPASPDAAPAIADESTTSRRGR